MKRGPLLIPALVLLAAFTALAKDKDYTKQEEVASSLRLLESFVEAQITYRGIPGISIGIVHNQDLVWAKGFGYADIEKKLPATPQTLYRIGSVTKAFTATTLMQLRDQGKLGLDDPLEKHLPAVRIKAAGGDASPITLRQLATHTSGLPRESTFSYWTDGKFPTRDEMMKALATQTALFPPATLWKYSNLGVALEGEVVSMVAGVPYEMFLQRQLLDPLGMKSTAVGVPDSLKGRLAQGYGRRQPDGTRELRPFTDAKALSPAAGISSTIEDLARFASLQFQDGNIVKASTLKEMHRVHWLRPDWTSGQGLGYLVLHRGESDWVGMGGWVAGYQCALYFRPKDKIAAIVLTNADDGEPFLIIDKIFRWVAPPLAKAANPTPPPPKPKSEWNKYLGKYRSPWGDTQILIHNGKLVLIGANDDDPASAMVTLVPAGTHRFRLEDGPPASAHGEAVVFEMKDDKVARMKVVETYFTPIPAGG